jgi:acyl dehydratase
VPGRGSEQLRLPVPARPGATLTGAVEIADIAEQVTRADVTYRSTLTDEEGRVVLSFLGIAVVARRSVAG